MISSRALVAFLCIASASGFAPMQPSVRSETSLNSHGDALRKAFTTFAAGAVILSNVAVAPAVAFDGDFGSSQVIAAKSGGRAGGRAAPKAPPAARAAARTEPQREIIRETRIIRETPAYAGGMGPSVVAAPPVMMAPPMMAPAAPSMPGLGLVAGLGAINAITDGMREAKQENEIREAKKEVVEARIKEAQLEARLAALERSSMPAPVAAQ